MNIALMKYLALRPIWDMPDRGGGSGDDNADGNTDKKPAGSEGDGKDTNGDSGDDDKAADGNDKEGNGDGDEADAAKLRKRLKEIEDENARLLRESMKRKDELRRFKDVDPERYRELLSKEEQAEQERIEAERKAAEKAGDFERVKQMMAESHEREAKALKDRIAELEGVLKVKDTSIEELSLGNSFATSQFIGENLILSPTKARALYGSHFEIEDGKVVAYDKPAGARERTKLVDGRGEPLGFEAAIAAIVDADSDKNTILKSKFKPGAGSRSNSSGNKEPSSKNDGLVGLARMRASASDFLRR